MKDDGKMDGIPAPGSIRPVTGRVYSLLDMGSETCWRMLPRAVNESGIVTSSFLRYDGFTVSLVVTPDSIVWYPSPS